MRINYDFSDLEAFLAVMDTGTFHGAAARLNLSQSAITRRVQKLESALGAALFERSTRAVKPTLAAKRLQGRAEAMLQDAAETTRAMQDETSAFSHQRSAIVTVATIPTVVPLLLLPAIVQLRDTMPGTRVRIMDMSANEVAEAVARGDADFGIGSIALLEPSTIFNPLFEDPFGVIVPRGHVLADDHSVVWAQLAGHPLILPAKGTGNRLVIDEAMAKARQPLVWTFEVGRSTTSLELARAHKGAAILPRTALARANDIEFSYVPLREPEITRMIGLITRVGQVDSPAVAAFEKAVKSIATNLV